MNIVSLLAISLTVSCSGHHIIDTKGCMSEGVWYAQEFSDRPLDKNKIFEVKTDSAAVFSPVGFNTIYINEELEDSSIDCSQVDDLSVVFSTSPLKMLTRILPFFNSYDVKIIGTLESQSILSGR